MKPNQQIRISSKAVSHPLSWTLSWRASFGFLMLMCLSACGPYRSDAAMQDVEKLRASVLKMEVSSSGLSHRRAIYAIAKGDIFLKQARFAAGHSDHTGAIEFSQVARESFMEARILIQTGDTDQSTPTRNEAAPQRLEPEQAQPMPQAPLPSTIPASPAPQPEGSEFESGQAQ